MTTAELDVRPADVWLGSGVAFAVVAVAALVVGRADFGRRADAPAIDPGIAIPIAVRPVGDVGLPAGGGAAAVPAAWQRRASPAVSPDTSEPPTAAQGVAPARTKSRPRTANLEVAIPDPTPEASPDPNADSPEAETPAPDPSTQVAADPAPVDGASGVGEGTGEVGEGTGEGGEAGAAGTDPLFDRAVAFYRARLVAWFSSRFRVAGSGLPPEQLARYRVRAVVEVGEDLSIERYRIESADHPLFEAAADTMLSGLVGQRLPPPPENYPGAVQRRLTVTFTCSEDTCD